MRRRTIISVLMAIIMVMGVSYSQAKGNASDSGRGGSVEQRVDRMARVLGLSDTQKAQVTSLLQGEREKNASVRKQLTEYRKQLERASLAETFDEAAVQAIAASQAQLMTGLLVSHARVRNQINALLTPEQRASAEQLRPMKDQRRGHGHGPHFGEGF